MTSPNRSGKSTTAKDRPPNPSDTPSPSRGGLFQQPTPPDPEGPTLVGSMTGPPNPNPSQIQGPATPGWSVGGGAGAASPGDPGPSQGYGSGPRSTPGNKRGGLRKSDLKQLAATAVTTVGGVLCHVLTTSNSPEREAGLWMPDTEDVKGMSDPLASLAQRRAPEGVADNPDAVDLSRLVMAVGGYIGKQLRKRAELRDSPLPEEYQGGGFADDSGRWAPTTGSEPSPDAATPADREQPRKPAAGVPAFLRRRQEGATPTTDEQADLDLSAGVTDSERKGTA